MSYSEYLDRYFPAGQSAEGDLARNTKLLTFGKPGNAGAKFKGPFEKMIKALSLPKAVREDLGINDETVGDAYILENRPVVDVQDEDSAKKGAGSEEDD
jgi:hypothetical protein